MEYLKKLLKLNKFNQIPELETFFNNYSNKLESTNTESFLSFLKSLNIYFESKDKFTKEVNEKIYDIEKKVQEELYIKDYSKEESIEKIYLFANCYLDFYNGLFLKEESCKKLLELNPLTSVIKEIGEKQYENYIENNPFLLASIGRFSEPKSWNDKFFDLLLTLTSKDFELREPDFIIINHNIFKITAKKIIDKKCFNTHDKLLGVQIGTTLPKDFDVEEKAPILRTVTKIIHYHKEIAIFNNAFRYIQKKYPNYFTKGVYHILKNHVYEDNAPLFNVNDVIEGVSNRYIDKQIYKLASDYPDLKPFADVHNITTLQNNEVISLSLWRLSAWNLYNIEEHSIKMYRDDILADMLIEKYGENYIEDAINSALIDNGDNVYESIKRINYINQFNQLKNLKFENVILLHHNDADGISSGYITEKTLKIMGANVFRYSLEILFPEAVDKLLKMYPDIPVFIVDLGTQIIHHLISNNVKQDVYIFDHHIYDSVSLPKNIKLFNPLSFDINGDEECSTSVTAYLFSLAVLDSYKYGFIGLIGAIGDSMVKNYNQIKGLNAYPFIGAIEEDLIKENKGEYFLNNGVKVDTYVKDYINVLGSVGYQAKGIQLAFDLLDGKINFNDSRILQIKELKIKKYEEAVMNFKQNGFYESKYFYFFNIGNLFNPMGIKEIGNFLTYLINNKDKLPFKLNLNKYFFGAQTVTSVQGIGEVTKEPSFKVSMRVGDELLPTVKAKKMPDFFEITHSFKHIPGGIHAYSAAVIIEEKRMDGVIKEIESFIKSYIEVK